MRVYISADMEGVSGVVHSDQTDSAQPEYQYARTLMLQEVNAAVEGAIQGGAREVMVNDSHGSMRNLTIGELHAAATLLSGPIKTYSMMTGVETGFDVAFFTGYHARAGTALANLDHTYYGPPTVQSVWLNGVEMGEVGINAALAGHFGVPVVLVTGDQALCAEARQLLGDDLEVAEVKQAVGRVAARNLHPTRACRLIREAAQRAVQRKRSPFVIPPPLILRLGFARSSQAERCLLMPAVRRIAPRVVEYTHDDYLVLFNAFRALLVLGDVKD
jgi:D-amino peptidase